MQDESGLIEENRCLGENYYLLKITAPHIVRQANDGLNRPANQTDRFDSAVIVFYRFTA